MLEEEVIFAFVVNKSVWVIHPIFFRGEMKLRTIFFITERARRMRNHGGYLTLGLMNLAANLFDAHSIVGDLGLLGILAIIFAECGLLIGFFLPGDSLLFVTGLFIAKNWIGMNIWLAALLLIIAAILGNACGYWIGREAGPALFRKEDSKLFRREYVEKTHAFFEKYGARAIVLARFVPIVRTFITATAGMGRMPFGRFMLFSAIGAILWAGGVTILGYFLGNVAFIADHVELILIVVVVISVVPILIEWLRSRRAAS
jgi:membrane-associated protein